jgi:23S rRNA-/tRNA-specific pseudouridylate synthase
VTNDAKTTPDAVRPDVLYRFDGLVAVDKPAGWLVHAASMSEAPNLVSWLLDEHQIDAAPAHRLDRETSGIVVFGEHPAVADAMRARFEAGVVVKRYTALVVGRTRRKGQLNRPLKDARRGRLLEARTTYRLMEWLDTCSLLSVRPRTGRKHQIRRHLQGLGHALVGDTRYRPRKPVDVGDAPPRLWLHATRLSWPDGPDLHAPLPIELERHRIALQRREVDRG